MIKSIFNLSTGDVLIDADTQLESQYEVFEISLGFVSDHQLTVFSNLSFGYLMKANEQEVASKQYPENGEIYESTDQTVLTVDQVPVIAGASCELHVWAENAGVRIEESFSWEVAQFNDAAEEDIGLD